jgi:hypothetical protein
MQKTSPKLLKTYPFYHFKTAQDFQKFLQTKYKKGSEKIDYIDIAGILYTMENYDMDGREISYYNKRTGLGFTITTSNRYNPSGFTDAIVDDPYLIGCYRNDITFID